MRDPERPVSLKKPETPEEWTAWRDASKASAEACGRSHEDCEGCACPYGVPGARAWAGSLSAAGVSKGYRAVRRFKSAAPVILFIALVIIAAICIVNQAPRSCQIKTSHGGFDEMTEKR